MILVEKGIMKLNNGWYKLSVVGVLLCGGFLMLTGLAYGDGHHGQNGYHESKDLWGREALHGDKHRYRGQKSDTGNESTGQIAGWLFGAANLTVALSILSKAVKRLIPVSPEVQSVIMNFNRLQKKYLMRFHYFLNPAAVSFALLHWILSRCGSTALPEWSLFGLGLLAGLGLIMKFKLSPRQLRKGIYTIHSHPIILPVIIIVLIIGHMGMD
jgi:hypothetical protein